MIRISWPVAVMALPQSLFRFTLWKKRGRSPCLQCEAAQAACVRMRRRFLFPFRQRTRFFLPALSPQPCLCGYPGRTNGCILLASFTSCRQAKNAPKEKRIFPYRASHLAAGASLLCSPNVPDYIHSTASYCQTVTSLDRRRPTAKVSPLATVFIASVAERSGRQIPPLGQVFLSQVSQRLSRFSSHWCRRLLACRVHHEDRGRLNLTRPLTKLVGCRYSLAQIEPMLAANCPVSCGHMATLAQI